MRTGPSAGADPFDTAALRRAVLDTWAASPARFREDANAEEALAVGGYADRLLVELAANAVDAAAEAGRSGFVRFTLSIDGPRPELRAANVGAPLTAAGVAGLASLRASAKRGVGAAVGHFGVGFTAVLAVSDAPEVLSRAGGVRFSRERTAAAVTELAVPELTAELAARAGAAPVLRLPWPVETPSGVAGVDARPTVLFDVSGFDTEVRLPLRPESVAQLEALLTGLGDELLWALPGLTTVQVQLPGRPLRELSRQQQDDGRTVVLDGPKAGSAADAGRPPTTGSVTTRYRTSTRAGTVPAALLLDRPIEERSREQWWVTWILPAPDHPSDADGFGVPAGGGPVYLGAPTPTDEPLSVPARLVGTFPVDDTRRRLAPGPQTDFLLAQAAAEYAELVAGVPPQDRLRLVPTAGFPLGPVDATLRAAVLEQLSRSPVLVTAGGDPVVPSRASVVPGISAAAAELIERAVPGLLAAPRSRAEFDALRLLGVRTMPLAEATTALAGIDGPPAFWHQVYQALSSRGSSGRDSGGGPSGRELEDLANLPVPLTGGGRRIGPVGCLLPGRDAVDADILHRAAALAPDMRIVHPEAAHPLLALLGAVPADAAAVLGDPALGQAFRDFRDDLEETDPDPDRLAEFARLALDLAADPAAPSGGPFDDVVLTDVDGTPWPAAELLAPGAPLAAVLADDADLPLVGAPWAGYPSHSLTAIGVRTGVKVVLVADQDAELPDLDRWWDEVVGDQLPPEPFSAIADLDLIDERRWPAALEIIAGDNAASAAMKSGPDPSYTRWWIARFARLAGRPPGWWRLPEATELAGLYDELPTPVDRAVAVAVGVLGDAAAAVRSDPEQFVLRLTDPGRQVPAVMVPALTALAVDALDQHPGLPLPEQVRTLSGSVVDAAAARVLDLPWWAQVLDPAKLVAGGRDPERAARLLDLPVASAISVRLGGVDPVELSDGRRAALQRAALALRPFDLSAVRLRVVPDLSVQLGTASIQRVHWWLDPQPTSAGGLLVDGTPEGIGRAAAWLAGRWNDRHLAVAAAAAGPVTSAENGLE